MKRRLETEIEDFRGSVRTAEFREQMIMKLTLIMSDADGVENAIDDELTRNEPLDLDGAELEAVQEIRKRRIRAKLMTWLKDAETVRIEIDTDANTATLLKNK